ncbi:MAG: hypothetical protein GQE15_31005 [Archangiaceae bacterium]|nr:hypothetical protein [Archangiaceae bacterium]
MRTTHWVGWLLLAALLASWASGSGCGPAAPRCPSDGGPAWDVSEQCACPASAPDQCKGATRATCNSGSTVPYTLRWQLVNCGQRCLPPADGGTLATCQ